MAKVLIKRYPNRKLYNTQAKRYITLDDISELILEGHDVEVKDHETGEDLTGVTLSQIIFEREKRDAGYLPSALLANLIRTGGGTLDYMRRSLQASVGALRSLEAEIDQRIEALVRRGELAAEDAEQLRGEIKGRAAGPALAHLLDQRIETALHRLNIPSRVDLLRLQQQLDQLSAAIEELLQQQGDGPSQNGA
ncbi:MAG: phasin family protein [Caldilineales bacterium]|nr:phasin family protein [Caldilineales bacterium]MCX7902826.1 phasin family protein [Burkholderiaceae bacterium]MDW8316941.1 polyhydroxyalkanoate synthesis regulator DNA-binding domain-containing protein [Anaerolineae bacterium]